MKNNIILFGFFSFILIFWFQESKKNEKKNKDYVNNVINDVKLPLLVCCLVLLALECEPKKFGLSNNTTSLEINTSQPNF